MSKNLIIIVASCISVKIYTQRKTKNVRNFLAYASILSMLCIGDVFSSTSSRVTPSKIGFLSPNYLYSLTQTDEGTSQLSLMDQEGHVRDTWDVPPGLHLKNIFLSPCEEAFVVVEVSGVVRALLRSKARTPHYLGEILYTPQSLDQGVHVLGFSSPRKILIGATSPGFTKKEIATLEAQSYDLITQMMAWSERWATLTNTQPPTSHGIGDQEKQLHDFTKKMASLRQDILHAKNLEGHTQSHVREIDMAWGAPVRVFDLPIKITQGALCENGCVLMSDRHPVQKHITNMWHMHLGTGELTPVRTHTQRGHSFSEQVSHKLSAQGVYGFFLSYAGKTNTHNRLLRYDTVSDTCAVAYAAGEDIVSFGLSKASPTGYALLGGLEGNAQRLVILRNNDGVFEEDTEASAKVRKAVGGRRIERVKISPKGERVLVTSLDTHVPGWATHKDLVHLKTGVCTPLAHKTHDMPAVFVETLPSTADGVTSYTHLYTPYGDAANKIPLLVKLHGGPHDQNKTHYTPNLAQALRLGYAVAHVNYRGSTGRGKAFHNLIEGDQGGGEVDDVACALANILHHNPCLDADNVFVMGLSYGAYLATMLDLKYPGLSKGLILIGGIYDWTRWAEKKGHDQLYVDASNVTCDELDLRLKPIKYAGKITAPTLVIHGTRDDICSVQGARDLVRVMEDAGRCVTFAPHETDHFYEDEMVKNCATRRIFAFMETLKRGKDEAPVDVV